MLAGCATSEAVPTCAGFEKITVSEATALYLEANDPAALRQIIAHDEFMVAKCG